MKLTRLLLMALFLVTVFAGQAAAQEGGPTPSPDEINAIAKNLYCPVCENVPLDVCPTQACIQWRQQIGDLLAQGYTQQEVYDYFVQRYGDRVLAAPPARGLNWVLYVLPPVVLLAGILWLTRSFDAWRQLREFGLTMQEVQHSGTEIPKNTPAQKKDEYHDRLEDELKVRK